MIVTKWEGDDLWNVLNLPNSELYRLYGKYYNGDKRTVQMNVRSKANKLRRQYKQGKLKMPERSSPYDPEKEPERIEERRKQAAKHLGRDALETTVITIPTEHLDYHEKLQEALNSDGRVEKMVFRVGEHEGYIKNNEGEIEYTRPLKAERTIFQVNFDTEPEWPPVTRVESARLKKRERQPKSDARKAVVLSDLQIPYHDEKAVETALQIVRDVKPDKVILVGDLLDLESFSKFDNLPTYAATTQEAIIRAHLLLAQIRKLAPYADIVVLEGNHDLRMSTHVNTNAKAAFGLKRADEPEGWPVLSVPYLCAFDQLDVEYVSGYPANRYWINERLQVRHGNKVRSNGSTAKVVADNEKVSTIFGHVHRLETQYKTHQTFDGGKTNAAFAIGCLCKIDGSVPSTNRGVDLFGKPVENHENWQQAIAVVDYMEGDNAFHVSPIYINTFNNYRAIYEGRVYGPRA